MIAEVLFLAKFETVLHVLLSLQSPKKTKHLQMLTVCLLASLQLIIFVNSFVFVKSDKLFCDLYLLANVACTHS